MSVRGEIARRLFGPFFFLLSFYFRTFVLVHQRHMYFVMNYEKVAQSKCKIALRKYESTKVRKYESTFYLRTFVLPYSAQIRICYGTGGTGGRPRICFDAAGPRANRRNRHALQQQLKSPFFFQTSRRTTTAGCARAREARPPRGSRGCTMRSARRRRGGGNVPRAAARPARVVPGRRRRG